MKEKRYTLQEKQPIPIGWHPANEEEAVARIEAIEEEYENGQYIDADDFEKELTAQYPWLELKLLRKSMRMGNILMQMTLKKN